MSAWAPIAKHGDTEDEVRAALQESADAMLNDWRREQRAADDLPLEVIETVAAFITKISAANIARALPNIMKNMAVSAGAVKVH